MAKYAEKEAPLLERIIMQEGLERSKAEDWARDEITRLSEENARLREALVPFAEKEYAYEGWADIARAEVWLNVRDIRAAAAAIREGRKDEN